MRRRAYKHTHTEAAAAEESRKRKEEAALREQEENFYVGSGVCASIKKICLLHLDGSDGGDVSEHSGLNLDVSWNANPSSSVGFSVLPAGRRKFPRK